MPSRILFVDDEPLVLEGLKRSFHSMRGHWSMHFAGGGEEALRMLEHEPFDVIITDMRMPGMTGAQLLEEFSRRSPQTIRIALSGQCDRETIVRSVGPIHQYLTKPCDRDQLKSKIQHAIALRDLLENSTLKSVVSQLRTIPSFPASYQQMMAELQSPSPNLANLSELISADMGMSAKCLQLVNSAFFGVRSNVSSISEAVKLLGHDTIHALVLSAHIFSEFHAGKFQQGEIRWLWDHSLAVSGFARTLAGMQSSPLPFVEDAFTAGLLHDVGKLILASCLQDKYASVVELTLHKQIPFTQAEQEILGCTHSEVGAYLLGIWGLPHGILQAVAWHQRPSLSPVSDFSPLTVVHSACVFHSRLAPSVLSDQSPLDHAHLAAVGLQERVEPWFRACSSQFASHEAPA